MEIGAFEKDERLEGFEGFEGFERLVGFVGLVGFEGFEKDEGCLFFCPPARGGPPLLQRGGGSCDECFYHRGNPPALCATPLIRGALEQTSSLGARASRPQRLNAASMAAFR